MSLIRFFAILILLATFPLSGCLFHTHRVEQPVPLATLKNASKPELLAYINSEAAKIQTMQATVDIDTAVGGVKKGRVTEYEQIRGYVLARKPAMLRMEGLLPIVRTRAFDMVSNGQEFKVWIPPKNRFVVGRNDVTVPNPQRPLENLRPQIIYEALLLGAINEENEVAVLEDSQEPVVLEKGRTYEIPDYVIDVIHRSGSDSWLSRKIVFSRKDLLPDRQLIYDESGAVLTDVRYRDYKDFDGVLFPSRIEIKRPQEEYDITLTIVKMDLNQPLRDDQFVLSTPPGAQVIHLDNVQASPNGGGSH